MLKLFMLMLLATVISHIVFPGDELKGTVIVSMILAGLYPFVFINNVGRQQRAIYGDNRKHILSSY